MAASSNDDIEWSPELVKAIVQSKADEIVSALSAVLKDDGSSRALADVDAIRRAFASTTDVPPEDMPAAGGPPADAPAFPGYRVLAKAGAGGFGAVYRAIDEKLGRQVALKVVLPRAPLDERTKARFLREARALARVRHPNVLTIHAVLEHAGRIALATEFIEGRPLDALVADHGPLSAGEAAQAGAEVCRALAAVHAAGIVHRDVKPANVLREKGGRIVLADFGLGVFASDPSAGEEPGTISGSPLFMSPEQASGREVDARSDIYSAGVLLYTLATGKYPVAPGPVQEILERIRSGRLVPVRDARPDLPDAFARAVMKALETDPARRFQSAGEMESALLAAAGRPSGEGAAEAGGGSGRPFARRALIAAAALVAVAAAAFSLRGILPWRGEPPLVERATLFCDTPAAPRALAEGDPVKPGDQLFLEIDSGRPLNLYVINEDERGSRYLLFPRPGWDLHNPIQGGTSNRVPGKRPGELEPRSWEVTSQGGTEWICAVASETPIPELEELARNWVADAPPEVAGEPLRAVLRGIGGITKAGGAREAEGSALSRIEKDLHAQRAVLAEIVRELKARGEEGGGDGGPWVKVFELKNP